jgi:D-proline reductase (dithiol) PrdB
VISYIERTRTYYATLGYPPYHWAHNDSVPFTPFTGRIEEACLALLTTAAPHRPELGDQGPGAAYNAAAKFFQVYTVAKEPQPDLRISHLGYDRSHTTAADPNTWLPVRALEAAVTEGRLGALAERLIGVPTNRSQRATIEQDAPAALAACRSLAAEVALLVPT